MQATAEVNNQIFANELFRKYNMKMNIIGSSDEFFAEALLKQTHEETKNKVLDEVGFYLKRIQIKHDR